MPCNMQETQGKEIAPFQPVWLIEVHSHAIANAERNTILL